MSIIDSAIHVETYLSESIIDTPTCRRPNYHPFDPSIASITNRGTIMQKFQCNTLITHRFAITDDDKIRLVAELDTGDLLVTSI